MTTKPIDRRRDQAAAAHAAAERAQTTVAELQTRLRMNDDATREQEQALRTVEAEAKRLKRALKAQANDHARLEKAHRKAVTKADKAESRAAAVEQKYSKSVLADLVQREKERDRAANDHATADAETADNQPTADADTDNQPTADGETDNQPTADDSPADQGAG